MNSLLLLKWIPNVYLNNYIALIFLYSLIEAILWIFRIRSNLWKFYFRLLPILKVPLNLLSYHFSTWTGLKGIELVSLPKDSRTLNIWIQFNKPFLRASGIELTTQDGDQFGLFDLLSERFFPSLIPWVGGALLLFALIKLGLFIRTLILEKSKTPHPLAPFPLENLSPPLQKALRKKRVELQVTDQDDHSPYVLGAFNPKIRLPKGIEKKLTLAELEAVLYHELSHIRHLDLFLFPIIEGISSLFCLPLKSLKLTQEKACDESALRQGVSAKDLSLSLAKLSMSSSHLKLSHPFIRKHQTVHRIRNITRNTLSSKNLKLDLFYGFLLILMSYFVITSHVGYF